jgi:hypothetical protein
MNEVIKSLHCYFQDVVLGIIRNADQGKTSRLQSITENQAFNFNQSPRAFQTLRNLVEVGLPLVGRNGPASKQFENSSTNTAR